MKRVFFVEITINHDMYLKIKKKQQSLTKNDNFEGPFCLELDGVAARIHTIDKIGTDKYVIKSEVLINCYEKTTLRTLFKNNEVSLGLQSFNPKKYLVGKYTSEVSSLFPAGKAKLD